MRNQDKSIFIIVQITFQPFDMSLIQIVRRLVKQKDIRLFKQKLCHEHLGTLSAGELCHIPVQTDIHKAERTSDFLDFCIDQIEIMMIEQLLNRRGFFQETCHFFLIGTGHLFKHFIHGRFQVK